MLETQQPTPENQQRLETITSKWTELSEDAQTAAFFLSSAEQRTGVRANYFESMGLPKEAAEELISSGLVETKTRQEIASQFIEDHQSEVQRIKDKKKEIVAVELTDVEKNLLNKYDSEEGISQRESENPRYRFTDGVWDFVNSQVDEE